ncbi:hypothetical protein TVAG_432790 [Trichomonas vaginalis G3]|uniref:DUF3447 domain-containing protein n=1 Tax=Trichomonas vaginalis (strain ATCC PRA-98 / G3) TaxID=412133 RepID=A2DIS0_TRIV3|nr:spectrin binding [Trichomonas vaginalis G3]EAY19683.1 hypothetical protein TVAG_432790 [Trichomonas vaginalis G3]KAI5521297.1 spectrin binding [Trichomonas vaginalis G3]|eukprot:XP_001580669.1 hypothetical protein [Trichomonas vaginalis G3]
MKHFDYNLGETSAKLPDILAYNPPILGVAIFLKARKCIMLVDVCELALVDSRGYTLAHFAAASGDIELYAQFDATYSYTREDTKKDLPFHLASYYGHLSIVKAIAQNNRYIYFDHNGHTCASLATMNGHYETLDYLISNSFFQNTSVEKYKLICTAARYDQTRIMTFFRDFGFFLDLENDQKKSVLSVAAKSGSFNAVKLLISMELISPKDVTSYPPTVAVCCSVKIPILEYLLKMNFPLNVKDNYGRTPFWTAIMSKQQDMALYLLTQKGIDTTSIPSEESISPFEFAIKNDMSKVVKEMMKTFKIKEWKVAILAAKYNAVETFTMQLTKFTAIKISHSKQFITSKTIGLEIMKKFMLKLQNYAESYQNAFEFACDLKSQTICKFIIGSGLDFRNCKKSDIKNYSDCKTRKQKFMNYLIDNGGMEPYNAEGITPAACFACKTGVLENVSFVIENNLQIPAAYKTNTKFLFEAIDRREFTLAYKLIQNDFTSSVEFDAYIPLFQIINDKNAREIDLKFAIRLLELMITKKNPIQSILAAKLMLQVRNLDAVMLIKSSDLITKTACETFDLFRYANEYESLLFGYVLNASTNLKKEVLNDLNDKIHIDVIQMVLNKIPNVTSEDFFNMITDMPNRPDVVRLFYEKGNTMTNVIFRRLLERKEKSQITSDMFKVFVEKGLKVDEPGLLCFCLCHTKIDDFEVFPTNCLNSKYKEFTPLVWALYHGKSNIAVKLIKRGADPSIDCDGLTPIIAAAMHPTNLFALRLLIGKGASPSKMSEVTNQVFKKFRYQKKTNACILALERGDRDMLTMLKKFDFDVKNLHGGIATSKQLASFAGVDI